MKPAPLSSLSGMSVHVPISILHPFDIRSVSCNLAAIITTPATALQFASILIKECPGPNSFFYIAARDLLAGVLMALHLLMPGKWKLSDVVLILSDTNRTKWFCPCSPKTYRYDELCLHHSF